MLVSFLIKSAIAQITIGESINIFPHRCHIHSCHVHFLLSPSEIHHSHLYTLFNCEWLHQKYKHPPKSLDLCSKDSPKLPNFNWSVSSTKYFFLLWCRKLGPKACILQECRTGQWFWQKRIQYRQRPYFLSFLFDSPKTTKAYLKNVETFDKKLMIHSNFLVCSMIPACLRLQKSVFIEKYK